MHCGHCTAVCPQGAVHLDGVSPESLLSTAPLPEKEQLVALIRGRRSMRTFKKQPVPENLLIEALDTARYAPTGKNLENVSWLVLDGRDTLRRIADAVVDSCRGDSRMSDVVLAHDRGDDPIFRGAPCAVFACADNAYDLAVVNCAIAVSTLDLLLPVLGLGGCWAGYVMRAALNKNVRNVMGMEDGLVPMAGLMIGFPDVHYCRIPRRRELRVRWLKGEKA